jgi:ElaB/YqjD/DUF883 family membrane-anchored ribosome-binding protein
VKQNRISNNVPMIVGEGRRLIQQSARRAGRIARSGGRMVGSTVHQAGMIARRHPWTGLGTAIGAGFLLGGLCTFLFYRNR